MRLRPGANYYQKRIDAEQPVIVRNLNTNEHGVVTRVTPSGNHIPPQAHVVYGDDEQGYHELWSPLRDLERVVIPE